MERGGAYCGVDGDEDFVFAFGEFDGGGFAEIGVLVGYPDLEAGGVFDVEGELAGGGDFDGEGDHVELEVEAAIDGELGQGEVAGDEAVTRFPFESFKSRNDGETVGVENPPVTGFLENFPGANRWVWRDFVGAFFAEFGEEANEVDKFVLAKTGSQSRRHQGNIEDVDFGALGNGYSG